MPKRLIVLGVEQARDASRVSVETRVEIDPALGRKTSDDARAVAQDLAGRELDVRGLPGPRSWRRFERPELLGSEATDDDRRALH